MSSVVTWSSKVGHGFEVRVERSFLRTRDVVVVVVVVVSVASGQGNQRREKTVTQVLWQRFVAEMR